MNNITIIQAVKKLGIYTNTDLLKPIFHDKTEDGISYPKGSKIITSSPISTDSPTSIFIDTESVETTCPSTRHNITQLTLITEAKKHSPAKYVKTVDMLDKEPMLRLAVHDLSYLSRLYSYKGRSSDHCEIGSINKRMWNSSLIEGNKHIVVSLKVPTRFPNINELNKMWKWKGEKLTNAISKDFFPFFEIMKHLSSDAASTFNLTFEQSMQVTLLLTSETSYTYIRLSTIYALFNKVPKGYRSEVTPKSDRAAQSVLLNILMRLRATDIDDIKDETINKLDVTKEEGIDELSQLLSDRSIKEDEIDVIEPIDLVKHKDIITHATESLQAELRKGTITDKRASTAMDLIHANINDIPTITKADLTFKPNIASKTNGVLVDEQRMDTLTAFDSHYLDKIYDKQTKQVVYHMIKAGYAIKSYTTTQEKDYSNDVTVHKITFVTPNGVTSTIAPRVPNIKEDGSIKYNGKPYVLQKQKIDAPIKKIDALNVLLTSYISKFFIIKGDNSRANIGTLIHKELKNNAKYSVVVEGSNDYEKEDVPNFYRQIGRSTDSLIAKPTEGKHVYNTYGFNLNFNYKTRKKLVEGKDNLKAIEKHGILMGVVKRNGKVLKYITVKESSDIYNPTVLFDGKDAVSILTLLELKYPESEYAITKLAGKKIPLILPMLIWFGLDNTIARLKCKVGKYKASDKYVPRDYEYVIKFVDIHYVFDKREVKSSLMLSGFTVYSKLLSKVSSFSLNTSSGVEDFLYLIGLTDRISREFKLAEKLWVDPITEIDLIEINEPTYLPALFVRACEMLAVDSYIDQNHVSLNRVKGNERMNAFLMTTISDALRSHNNKVGKVRSPINVSPYEVFNLLASEPTFRLIEDLSPVSERAIKHSVTMIGMYGRNSDSITTKHRTFHESEVGYTSENTKNTADVGIVAQLSATPMLTNTNGVLTEKEDKELTTVNIISEAGELQPESLRQDTKRLLFQAIQSPSIIPTVSDHPNQIRTGFESVYPFRIGKKYAYHAEAKGTVLKVTDKFVTVKYGTETEKYELKTWLSRDEGGVTYKHKHSTLLHEGDKIQPGDNIYYDSTIMSRNIFQKYRVSYNNGQTSMVALDNGSKTYEDSSVISEALAEKMLTPLTYVRDIIVSVTDTILHDVSVGEHVTYEDSIFTSLPSDALDNAESLDVESLELLKELGSSSLMAEHDGEIVSIEVIYNSDLEKATTKFKDFISIHDKHMKAIHGTTGRVDHTYSHKGRGLDEDQIHIRIAIEHNLPMSLGDKGMISNVLKFTIGDVVKTMYVEEGGRTYQVGLSMNEESVDARIVIPPITAGRSIMLLQEATNLVMVATYGKDWYLDLPDDVKHPFV